MSRRRVPEHVTQRARLGVRLALAWGIVVGVGYVLGVPTFQPEQVGFASEVYYLAAEAFLAGENPYHVVSPAGSGFIYPPIALFAFVPHALTGSTLGAFLLQNAINLASAGALAWLVLSYLDDHLGGDGTANGDDHAANDADASGDGADSHGDGTGLARIDRVLVAGFLVLSVHSTSVYVMGQVNLQLSLAVAAGALLVERGRGELGGAAFAAAAAVKLFPAALGAWLLRLRRWRAVGAAIVTGAAVTLAGVLAVPSSVANTYFGEVLPAESKAAEFAGGLPPEAMYVTIRRPIAALLPGVDPTWYVVLGALVLAPFVLASYRAVGSRVGRLTALLATTLGTLLLLPFEAFYFSLLYFPLVPLLYLVEPGRVRRLLAAGTVLLSTVVSYRPLELWVAASPVPGGVEAALLDAARAVFGIAQPPLVGGLLVLVACALWHHESATD